VRSTLLNRNGPATTGTSDVTPTYRVLVARRHGYLAVAALLVITNLMVILGVDIAWISPATAFVTIIGIPTFLLYGANPAGLARGSERLAVSAVLSIGLLMVSGLFANSVGPHLSIGSPLGGAGSITIVDLAVLGLGIWAWPRHPEWYRISSRGPAGPGGGAVAGGAVAVALAVFGAVRLNNGAGAGVTLVALGVVLLTFAGLMLGRHQIEPGAVVATIYLLSAAILLMTSLRGWYTTGHDIQREFQVFQLTDLFGRWDMARYQDGYNACLSITILPTILGQWTRVAHPYVFKVFFQLLFALCPVMVYLLARRFVSGGMAILATMYFVAFPTFLQDMPFLNRQEIAFLFLAAGLLCLFNPDVELARRKRWFCVLAVGMVTSHYSTTYVTVAVLLTAIGLRIGIPLIWARIGSVARFLRTVLAGRAAWMVVLAVGFGLARVTDATGAIVVVLGAMALHWIAPTVIGTAREHGAPGCQGWLLTPPARSSALGLGTIGFVAAASVLWTGPLTHTSGGITSTVSSAVAGLAGRSPASKSSDTSYSLFSTAKPSAGRLLDQYRSEADASSALRPASYYDAATVSQYPTPVAVPSLLPTTRLGGLAERFGVDLPGFNRVIRQGSARMLQLFIALGLLVGVFARRRTVAASADLICLAAANLFVLALQVLLPALSVDYGVLRAFQQGLLVLDVFLVVGSVALVPRFLGRWQRPTVALIALCLLASSTGFVTQLLGGYGAQLHLNNSGQYFDLYFVHPEEVAAGAWLRRSIDGPARMRIQSVVQTDRFTFPALQSLEIPATRNDILPSLVRRESYVVLGTTNVVEHQSTVSVAGDLITYRYPIGFLDANKDLLYSTAGSRVYR